MRDRSGHFVFISINMKVKASVHYLKYPGPSVDQKMLASTDMIDTISDDRVKPGFLYCIKLLFDDPSGGSSQ